MIRIIKLTLIGLSVVASSAFAETNLERLSNQAFETLDSIVATITTTPLFNQKDTECLARNIYYESKHEPEEGMVAVGVVTINRSQDGRYPTSICGVVQQRHSIGQSIVCQFSWTCTPAKHVKPREDDPWWQKSKSIAQELSLGGYQEWRQKYQNSLHFHSIHVNPGWKLKRVAKTGRHIFYH